MNDDDTDMVTNIIPNLPKAYENMFDYMEEKLNKKYNKITIKRIKDKIRSVYNIINVKLYY